MITEVLQPGDRIFVAGASNEPAGLLAQLREVSLPADLAFQHFPIGSLNHFDFTALNDSASVTTFFMSPALAKAADPARVHFLPMHMRWVFDYVRHNIDVAMIQVAYDRNGELRLGPNVDFVDAALQGARCVIAELNTQVVAPAGCPRIARSRIDVLVESDRPLPQMAPPTIDTAAEQIGALVAQLINDGDCIQTGIGAIPAAILARLSDKQDLGLHGGLIDDAGMALVTAGNVNGSRKQIDTGVHIAGIAMGTQALYDWLAQTPGVLFRGADHTHEPSVIGQLNNFVSINSAVEVDLFGQVNAEVANGRQISGTGGSVDFMRAARSSAGGRSIVAMNATARGGSVSRIVPAVAMVTALRTDIDMVVTEYGVAAVKHLPLAARAQALIEVAAPQFRDELQAAARQMPGR